MSLIDPVPAELSANDLLLILRGAVHNNGHLLSAIERALIEEIVDLPEGSLRLLARLLERKGPPIRLDHIPYEDIPEAENALEHLKTKGLVVELAHGWVRTGAFTVAELKQCLRENDLSPTGPKETLVERVLGVARPPEGRVIAVLPRVLVRRCEWLFFGVPGANRKRFLLERLGRQKWMSYATSDSVQPFASRAHLLQYERHIETPLRAPGELVLALSTLGTSSQNTGSGFSLHRLLRAQIRDCACSLEQRGEPEGALQVYRALEHLEGRPHAETRRRMALCLENLGREAEGAELCQESLEYFLVADSAGLARTGRRLARKSGGPWRPPVPLSTAPVRQVAMPADEQGWSGGMRIEEAVMSGLGERKTVWKEGRFWTSLFSLLMFDLLWEKDPGMLPAPCLPGPLDLGRPGFSARRSPSFSRRISRIEVGAWSGLFRAAFRFEGVRVRGLDWGIATPEEWEQLLASFPPSGLAAILDLFGTRGFAMAKGMPDLVIWPGKAVRLSASLPSSVPEQALLVEVKGPNDQLRDAQKGWHHRLLTWDFLVETWRVEELGKRHANHRRQTSRASSPGPEGRKRSAYIGPSPGGPLFDSWAGPDGL